MRCCFRNQGEARKKLSSGRARLVKTRGIPARRRRDRSDVFPGKPARKFSVEKQGKLGYTRSETTGRGGDTQLKIQLEITAEGGIQMLHDDNFDMSSYGEFSVVRASNVEFDNKSGCWYVSSAKTNKLLASGFASRAQALAWEKKYYSPAGKGWEELAR